MAFLTDPNQNEMKMNEVLVFVKMSLSYLENLAVFKEFWVPTELYKQSTLKF